MIFILRLVVRSFRVVVLLEVISGITFLPDITVKEMPREVKQFAQGHTACGKP